jgi:hypothetical protein
MAKREILTHFAFGKTMRKWEYNIKMYLGEIRWEVVAWIYLLHVRA